MKLKKLFRLIDKALAIRDNPYMDWEEKFDIIFGMWIWKKIDRAGYSLRDWTDPDTSYEEDIMAYCKALENFKKEQVAWHLENVSNRHRTCMFDKNSYPRV